VLFGQRVEQGDPGDAQAAVVGGVFAQGELAVELCCGQVAVCGGASKPPYSATSQSVRSVNLAVLFRLPLAQVALAVVLGALVVEAVGHLMADDDADAAEVDGGVDAVKSKKGGCRMPAGKLMSFSEGS
jgi:hypothetical protein